MQSQLLLFACPSPPLHTCVHAACEVNITVNFVIALGELCDRADLLPRSESTKPQDAKRIHSEVRRAGGCLSAEVVMVNEPRGGLARSCEGGALLYVDPPNPNSPYRTLPHAPCLHRLASDRSKARQACRAFITACMTR